MHNNSLLFGFTFCLSDLCLTYWFNCNKSNKLNCISNVYAVYCVQVDKCTSNKSTDNYIFTVSLVVCAS